MSAWSEANTAGKLALGYPTWGDELVITEAEFNALQGAWRDFVEFNRIDESIVRPEVAASWRRCAALGVDARAPKQPVKLSTTELARAREANRSLIETALPFMHFLETAVKGTGFILALTDRNGIVLEAFGDEDILEMARENNYVPGCCRSEAEVGTNAIGLALHERKAVQLTGPEHYNQRHHRWTCASAPIFDPGNELLGTATLSGESIAAHRHTFGMVISAAEAIHDRLCEREAILQKGRVTSLLASVLGSISEAIVTVDGSGIVTQLNAKAARMLSVRPDDVLGKSILRLFPNSPQLLGIIEGGRETPPLEVAVDAGKVRTYVIVTPYLMRNEGIVDGAILALTERREFVNGVREISGFNASFSFDDIVGSSTALKRQIELATIAARQDARILITGETGTGKELFAQAIHNASRRRGGPFVAINCAAIPRELLESEIFGYKGGAFTGARKGGQVGKLELADGGTIFLDEISQMPLDLQAKLLRVLQDGMITRLGDSKPVKVDARVLAATNEDLLEKSRSGGFRLDLYYRLGVVELGLPALRERDGDIALLCKHVLGRICARSGQRDIAISPAALAILEAYAWPGNIRELENVLEMAAIICEGAMIQPEHLAARVRAQEAKAPPSAAVPVTLQTPPMREVEIEVLRSTMKEFGGNVALVSRKLGISRSTIYRRMKEHGISRSVQVS